jgi:hypothetical protein
MASGFTHKYKTKLIWPYICDEEECFTKLISLVIVIKPFFYVKGQTK